MFCEVAASWSTEISEKELQHGEKSKTDWCCRPSGSPGKEEKADTGDKGFYAAKNEWDIEIRIVVCKHGLCKNVIESFARQLMTMYFSLGSFRLWLYSMHLRGRIFAS